MTEEIIDGYIAKGFEVKRINLPNLEFYNINSQLKNNTSQIHIRPKYLGLFDERFNVYMTD